MLTIFAFINLIGSFFNCGYSVYVFSQLDDVVYKPELGTKMSIEMNNMFPIEFTITAINMQICLIYFNWFYFIILLPIFVYNLKQIVQEKFNKYQPIGEKVNYSNLSMKYKFKFIYYLFLLAFNLMKFIICSTNMISYHLFGDINLLYNIFHYFGIVS